MATDICVDLVIKFQVLKIGVTTTVFKILIILCFRHRSCTFLLQYVSNTKCEPENDTNWAETCSYIY